MPYAKCGQLCCTKLPNVLIAVCVALVIFGTFELDAGGSRTSPSSPSSDEILRGVSLNVSSSSSESALGVRALVVTGDAPTDWSARLGG